MTDGRPAEHDFLPFYSRLLGEGQSVVEMTCWGRDNSVENGAENLLLRDSFLQSIKTSSMASAQEFRLVALPSGSSGSSDIVKYTA